MIGFKSYSGTAPGRSAFTEWRFQMGLRFVMIAEAVTTLATLGYWRPDWVFACCIRRLLNDDK